MPGAAGIGPLTLRWRTWPATTLGSMLPSASSQAGPPWASPPETLDLPIRENNQELHDLATRYLDRHILRGQAAFTVQVRQAVDALLGTGTCSHSEVAKALYDRHPRSLQRQLRQEGTAFEAIKDEAQSGPGSSVLVPNRDIPASDHSTARLYGAVGPGPKLPSLVPYDARSKVSRGFVDRFHISTGQRGRRR